MTLYHPRPERWPQFGFKGFLVVVTLLCISLGWVRVQLKWIQDRHEALRWLEERIDREDSPQSQRTYWRVTYHGDPPWSIRMFGETGVEEIPLEFEANPNDPFSDEQLMLLFPEATVEIRRPTH